MNNNDFLNNLRILLGGKENWTDEKQNYKAANDTSLYNTDMFPYIYSDRESSEADTGWATNWRRINDYGDEEMQFKNPGEETKTIIRINDTYNGEGDSIENGGKVKIGNTGKNMAEEIDRNAKAAQEQNRYDAFFNVLRGLFGLFDGKK